MMHPARRLLLILCLWPALAAAVVSVRDDKGRTVSLEAPAARIVSLSPHATELLFAAGAGAQVVGVASYSNFPPAARRLPAVGSAESLNLEAIVALQPDLVVAWASGNPGHQVERLQGFGLPVFFSEPRHLEDIASNLERLGRLAGTTEVARQAAADFRRAYQEIGREYAHRAPVRTFYQIWHQPLITVNGEQLISEVIRLCGGRNVFAALPTLAPSVEREAVLAADPQAIIASGLGAERPEWLEQWRAWPSLSAVRHRQLYAIDPDLIQRQTPRIVAGAKILCRDLDRARRAQAR